MHELLSPPHEYLYSPYSTIYDIDPFVQKFFSSHKEHKANKLTAFAAQEELRKRHKATNFDSPPEQPLLFRTWLAAAEYGFPAIFEHRKNYSAFKKEFTDPLHLIATLIKLSKRNIKMAEMKLEVLNIYQLTDDEKRKLWAYHVRSSYEELALTPEKIFGGLSYGLISRYELELPILIPDTNLHKKVSQFDLSVDDADKMTQIDLRRNYFPQMHDAFTQICDLDELIKIN